MPTDRDPTETADCLDCGVCPECIERSAAHAEEHGGVVRLRDLLPRVLNYAARWARGESGRGSYAPYVLECSEAAAALPALFAAADERDRLARLLDRYRVAARVVHIPDHEEALVRVGDMRRAYFAQHPPEARPVPDEPPPP